MNIQRTSTVIVAAAILASGVLAQGGSQKNPKKPGSHGAHTHKGKGAHNTGGANSTTRGGGLSSHASGQTGSGAHTGTGQGASSHGSGTHPTGPTIHRGVDAPAKTAFVNPSAPVSSNNYPRPHTGNTYVTNNITVIQNNYRYDSAHYSPHVANFYGTQSSPAWGGGWRYGVIARPGVTVSFGFGFYVYTPFYASCVASPWYYYPGVPAYLPANRVFVYSEYGCDWTVGVPYDYTYETDQQLNQAVGDVSAVFTQGNVGSIGTFLGSGQIAIFSDGKYEYSLNAPDFQQLLSDNVSATQTNSFAITKVRRSPYGAIIEATHVFQNPAGGTETVYQLYRLQRTPGGYIITDFMTSHLPFRRGVSF